MNNLIKHEESLSIAKKIEFSKQSNILRDHNTESIHDVVKIALIKAKQLTGYNTTEPDLAFFLSEVKKELLSNFKGLHLTEITISFDLWSKQHYGQWVGFTVSNYLTYGLRPYYGDQVRIEALKDKEKPKEIERPPYDGTNRLEELKKEFKEKGWAEDTGNIIYDWLKEKGELPINYGSTFYLQAKDLLKQEHKKKLITELNGVVRQNLNKILEEIETNQSNQTIVLAKKLALNAYLKEMNLQQQ